MLALSYIKEKNLFIGVGAILYQHKSGRVSLYSIDKNGAVCAGVGLKEKTHKAIIQKMFGSPT
jgi:hypothetical protein